MFENRLSELKNKMKLLESYPFEYLAEKVESQETFHLCKEAGFNYFQGFFLCRARGNEWE